MKSKLTDLPIDELAYMIEQYQEFQTKVIESLRKIQKWNSEGKTLKIHEESQLILDEYDGD